MSQVRHSHLLSPAGVYVALLALWALSVPSAVEGLPPIGRIIGKPYTMLEFRGLECAGKFDRSMVATLNMVCLDCYHMYKEPELYGLCR